MKTEDPVCGMVIDHWLAVASRVYRGKVYYFCDDLCVQLFDQEPGAYATAPGPARTAEPVRTRTAS